MLPLLTFASGLVAGIVGIRMLKTVKASEGLRSATHTLGDKARTGLDQAQTGLRDAAVSSLSAIEKTSATLRGKLAPAAVEAVPAESPVAEAKPAARKAAARKVKVAPSVPAEAKPARKRAARKPKAAPEAPTAEAQAEAGGNS